MGHSRFTGDEIARRGQQLYDSRVRDEVETEENIGRIVSIDIETGGYNVADTPLEAGMPLHDKRGDAALFAVRIGHDAVYSFGGSSFVTLNPPLVRG